MIRKYWTIYKAFWRTSLARELEFRANFIAKMAINLVWISFYVISIAILFNNTSSIGTWTRGDVYILAAFFTFAEAIAYTIFVRNTQEIAEMIRNGNFDGVLLRPVNTQFLASLRFVSFDEIGTLLGSIAMFAYGLTQTHTQLTASRILLALGFIGIGLIIFYCFAMFITILVFWFIKLDNIRVLMTSTLQLVRFPADVLPTVIRRILVVVLPISFISTIPTQALLGRDIEPWAGIGVIISLLLFYGVKLFWDYAIKSYSSASS